jgi:chemotaxis-related protein WspD
VSTEIIPLDDCWNRIGVRGDHSCPELATVLHCHNCPVFARAGRRLFERPPPPECVAEWTERLASRTEENTGDVRPLIVFRVGPEWLAFDVHTMVEVAETRRCHRIPHRRHTALLGIVNIRGELQLCLSLRELLAIKAEAPAQPDRTGWLLVVEQEGRRWALAVDEVSGVMRVPQRAMSNVPATVSGSPLSAAQGVILGPDKRIGCLDTRRLFDLIVGCLQ